MKPRTLLLLCYVMATQLTEAQSYLKAFALPSNSTLMNRPKATLKLAPNGNVWVVFTGRKYGQNLVVSDNGIAKFDGNNWVKYNTSNSQLPSNYATDIGFDGNDVWVGTKAGLAKLSGSTWTIYNKSNSQLVYDSINDIHVDQGTIWIGTDKGVSYFTNNTFTNYTSASGLISDKVNCIERGLNGEVYFGTDNGISSYNTNTKQWNSFTKSNSGLRSEKIHTLKKDAYGNIWIGADSAMQSSSDFYPSVYVLKNGVVKSLFELSDICGVNWGDFPIASYSFATLNGKVIFDARRNMNKPSFKLLQYSNNALTYYEITKPALVNQDAGFLMDFDQTGELWFTSRDGVDSLYQFNPGTYTKPDNAPPMSYLSINKVRTPILTGGDMFWDLNTGGYEVPKGSCKKAIFTGSLWMGGVTNNNLKIAAQTYRQSGNDYWGGPTPVGGGNVDTSVLNKYNRLWNLNRFYIEEFRKNFANGNLANGTYTMHNDIKNWPAMGDQSKGIAKYLAPFVDYDSDGIYNPMKGDYPLIIGDQMVYWIFNDKAFAHTESQGVPLGVEVHGSAYAYVCDQIGDNDSNTALNYTTFYHYKMINRSQEKIDSFKVGLWMDVDLGNYSDDYVGCNPKEGYGYGYNGDDEDEGNTGYGTTPPAIATVILKGLFDSTAQRSVGMNNFLYYNNDNTLQGNPNKPSDYWNYINARWRDNSHVTYGGSGKGGADTATFMFPGTNDLGGRSEWSESTAQNNPGDRRYLMTVGPIALNAGGSTTLDYAIVFSRAISGGALASVAKLQTDIAKVKNWYNTQNYPSCFDLSVNGINEKGVSKEHFSVYPNPAKRTISIGTTKGMNSAIETYEIFDLTGKSILQGKFNLNQEINIDGLMSGMYFIRMSSEDRHEVARFIKE